LPINPENNNRARERLLRLIREGHAVVLTGAGLSAWAGYPSWTELLDRLVTYISEHGDHAPAEEARAREIVDTHENPLQVARQLGGMLAPSDFAAFINEELGPKAKRSHEMVNIVASLPFRHFLTLNLDPTLYDALVLSRQPFESFTCYQKNSLIKFVKSLSSTVEQYSRQLVHLHGRHSDPLDNVALTTDGYNDLYGHDLFSRFFQTLAMTQRIVFVGFGFQDQNFMEPFRVAARSCMLEFCHFAIVPLSEDKDDARVRNKYRDEWCVEPIFYPKNANNDGHGGYGEFRTEILRIAQELEITPKHESQPAQKSTAAPSLDHDDTVRAEQLSNATLEQISGEDNV